MIFWPLKLALKIVSALLSLLIIYLGVTFVQIWMTGREHSTVDAGAILVFGTAEDNGRPSPELADRLHHADVLYKDGRAPIVAVTGGRRRGDAYTEAEVSATYLEARGVPRRDIVEGAGSDTWRNVASVAGRLRSRGVTTVLTVTDPFHEYRAMAIASDQGLRPYPSPVAHSAVTGADLWKYYAKETLEVGVARVLGYHTLSDWLHVD
jgi:uncharacterized SAM-binding protein YcdF (DUF218 family)